MSQHFLLSAAARTLSLSAVARMLDEEAHAKFVEIRWAENDGQPFCPKCGCVKVYAFATRKLWKCSACRYQFSVTARTIFQDRKRPIWDYLLAIAIFVNGAKGHSALQLSRDLDCQYKTAFVLAHKLREAIGSEVHNPDQPELSGTVEIDGAYFGGKVKPENRKADRKDRRLAEEQTGKRQVVVVPPIYRLVSDPCSTTSAATFRESLGGGRGARRQSESPNRPRSLIGILQISRCLRRAPAQPRQTLRQSPLAPALPWP